MPKVRTSIRKIREVLRLSHVLGLSQRQVTRSVLLGQSTVWGYLSWSWSRDQPEVEDLHHAGSGDQQIGGLDVPMPGPCASASPWPTCVAMSTASSSASGPRSIRSLSVSPS